MNLPPDALPSPCVDLLLADRLMVLTLYAHCNTHSNCGAWNGATVKKFMDLRKETSIEIIRALQERARAGILLTGHRTVVEPFPVSLLNQTAYKWLHRRYKLSGAMKSEYLMSVRFSFQFFPYDTVRYGTEFMNIYICKHMHALALLNNVY